MPERILAHVRPARSTSLAGKGRILIRVDPQSYARATRLDLENRGYAITNVRSIAPQHLGDNPDLVFYFYNPEEGLPPSDLHHVPDGVPVVFVSVGSAALPQSILESVRKRGAEVLTSRWGPSLQRMLASMRKLRSLRLS